MTRIILALSVAVAATPAAAVNCSVDAQAVAFGSYDPLGPAATDGVGNVHVVCDAGTSFTVALDGGFGTIDDRTMTSGADALHYNLYSNASRTAVWGDGNGASDVSASGTTVDLPVYGRIPGLQNVPVGTYLDTIAVTVTF